MPLQDLPAGFIELNDTILSRNHVPTEEQVPELKVQLELGKADLIDLEDEFVQASLALADVTARRAARRKQVQALSAVLAPIRRIPPELLAEIFGHCVRASGESITYKRAAPLLLGRICSPWRTVLLSCPLLWSNVDLHLPSTHFHEILHRSAAAPLSLSISTRDWGYKNVVLSVQSRLRNLSLHLTDFPHGPPLGVNADTFPSLHTLNITLSFERLVNDNITPILPLFATAPKLRVLSLKIGIARSSWLPSLVDRFPWSQLTSLSIQTTMDIPWLKSILSLCEGLESLKLWCYTEHDVFTVPLSLATILSPRLRFLKFGTPMHTDLWSFFMSFSCPGLISVDVLCHTADSEFAQLSGGSPRELSLRGIEFLKPELLVSFLETLPSITSLSIDFCTLHNDFFQALNRHATTTSFLPHLDTLQISSPRQELDGGVVADMLESRTRPQSEVWESFPGSELTKVTFESVAIRNPQEFEARVDKIRLPGWNVYPRRTAIPI